jgi:hypothetical protein
LYVGKFKGLALSGLKKWRDAEQAFVKFLDIFPGHQQIELELSKVRQELKKSEN